MKVREVVCIIPVCLQWGVFLQLVTDVRGKAEKHIFAVVFLLLCGSIIQQGHKYHIQLRLSHSLAKPLPHLLSDSPSSCVL